MPANAEQEADARSAEGEASSESGDSLDAAASTAPATDAPADALGDEGDLRAELEEVRERWTRAVADYQNLRRRSAEERVELRMQLLAGLVGGYLGVLDDLDRALDSIHQHKELAGHPWVDGVRLVRQKFAALIEGSGVTEIAAEGEPFDPLRHEAVAYQTGPEGRVVAVVQPGFEAGSQVVRPARVVVGNGPSASNGRADSAAGGASDSAADGVERV
jgi:molecular chaperone GrpE